MSAVDVDSFLAHDLSPVRAQKSTYLKAWRARRPAVFRSVLHTKVAPQCVWRHPMWREYEGKTNPPTPPALKFWNWNCLEHEETLRVRYQRDERDERLVPPERCPLCLLAEHVRREINAGSISIEETVFCWDVGGRTKRIVAGNVAGMIGNNTSAEDLSKLRAVGISPQAAWRENIAPSANYLFAVVDYDDPSSGVQIAVERPGLADKLKAAIRKRRRSMGDVEGDPFAKPVVLEWSYDEQNPRAWDRYDVTPLDRLPLGDNILELITNDPPSFDDLIRPGDPAKLRAVLQSAAAIPLPWGDLFPSTDQNVDIPPESFKDWNRGGVD